jgi:hypothetical protein
MIKNKRTSYGLDKRFAQINEFEESGVFEIRMPLDFKLGKNEVKLKLLPNKLLKGSEVLIDIFDKNGNSIYYEISNLANEDESRSLIVFIYDDTVPGKCRLFINAVLQNNKTYQCQITSDVITTVENTQEIKFSEEPKVKYTERTLQTQVFSTSTRQTSKNGTGDISIVSTIAPKQTERDNLSIEKKEVRTVDQITSVANNVGSGSTFEIPTFFSPSTIISRNFPFSSSMEGGTIFVNGIQLEVPSNALSSIPFLNQSFSASILKVIGTGAIEIYPPFRKTIEYQTSNGLTSITFDRFFNHSNFTASYKELLTLASSGYSQSYAVFDLSNIQPNAGVIDTVEVSYKSLNLIGSNYQPVGTFEVKSENLLIDSASVFFKNPEGIVETPIGNFRSGLSTFNAYWSTSYIGSNFPTASVSSQIVDGIKIDYGTRTSTGSFVIIEPKSQYKVNIGGENTQINLSFDSFSESDIENLTPQLDIYISGSEIISEPSHESIQLTPIASSSFGTYIGSISQKFGKLRKNSLTFVTKNPGNILPKLISRVGSWHIGNIELKPIDEKGFNCNQTRIYAPMNLPTGSEVNFKIDYLNPAGRKKQTFSSIIEGVLFQGSTIRSGATIPSGTVSGSDQLTGSFDNRYETRGRSIVSGSEQLTSSYDGRYEMKGTGIVSSSNQIANDISGSSTSLSSSLSGRIAVYDGKTLFSASQQVVYSQIQGIPSSSITGSGQNFQIPVFSGSNGYLSGSNNLMWSGSTFYISGSTRILSTNNSYIDFIPTANGFNISGKSIGTIITLSGAGNVLGINQPLSLGSATVSSTDKLVSKAQTDTSSSFSVKIQNNSTQPLFYIRDDGNIGVRKASPNYNLDISGSANIDNNLTISGSLIANRVTGSFSGSFQGMPSSSAQIKDLLPVNVVSGSDQLTGSYDGRYERRGTGLYSSSIQVDYNQITNKPIVNGSRLYGILISSGSESSSYSHQNLTYDTSQSKFRVTGSTNLNGNLFQTGSTSTRMTYIWDGPKTVGVIPGIEWTNMENQPNTWLGSGGGLTRDSMYIGDFTEITQGRLFTAMSVGGAGATASLEVQYSLDGTTAWTPMITLVVGTSGGIKDSGWARIPAGSQQFTYIRLVGFGGNGIVDPKFSPPIALFR